MFCSFNGVCSKRNPRISYYRVIAIGISIIGFSVKYSRMILSSFVCRKNTHSFSVIFLLLSWHSILLWFGVLRLPWSLFEIKMSYMYNSPQIAKGCPYRMLLSCVGKVLSQLHHTFIRFSLSIMWNYWYKYTEFSHHCRFTCRILNRLPLERISKDIFLLGFLTMRGKFLLLAFSLAFSQFLKMRKHDFHYTVSWWLI